MGVRVGVDVAVGLGVNVSVDVNVVVGVGVAVAKRLVISETPQDRLATAKTDPKINKYSFPIFLVIVDSSLFLK